MKTSVLRNWIKAIMVLVLGCVALVMLMAEPEEDLSMLKWMGVFIASKVAALVCGYAAYKYADELTKEKEA